MNVMKLDIRVETLKLRYLLLIVENTPKQAIMAEHQAKDNDYAYEPEFECDYYEVILEDCLHESFRY